MRRQVGGTLVLAALVLVANEAHAAPPEPIELRAGAETYDLVERIEFLADDTGELDREELHAGARAGDWFTTRQPSPSFGFTSTTYWMRLRLYNPGDRLVHSMLSFDYALLDEVDVHVEQPGDTWRVQNLGDQRPFSERPIRHNKMTLELETAPGERAWIYVRVRTASSMRLGVSLSSVAGFVGDTTRLTLFYGLYYGIMVAMALYNLFLYLAVRIRAYIIYVLFIVVFGLCQFALDGQADRYLFPDWPAAGNLFTPLTVGGSQVPCIWFAQTFLETRTNMPRLHRFLTWYMGLMALSIPLSLFGPYAIAIRIVAISAIVTSLVCLYSGIAALRQGYRAARYFVLAWLALITGTIAYVLVSIGVLPANALTIHSQRIGSGLEVTLLSFALGDRINTIQREREVARAKALALDHDLALTAAVQQLFLPKNDRYRGNGLELVGFYRPADRSGGDWWWYRARSSGELRVLVGDIGGHGAAAAMLTGAVAAAHQNINDTHPDQSLHDNLRALGRCFVDISEGLHHMCMVALEIDSNRSQLKVWSAGAPPVLVLRASGEVVPLLTSGSLIGDEPLKLGEATHNLAEGDRILAFSDGLPELARPNGRQLGYAAVTRMLAGTRDDDATAARDRLERELDRARGSSPQLDDLCFVLIDVSPAN